MHITNCGTGTLWFDFFEFFSKRKKGVIFENISDDILKITKPRMTCSNFFFNYFKITCALYK